MSSDKSVRHNWFSFFSTITLKELVFTVILFITSMAIFVPLSPRMPISGGVDPSWFLGLNQARQQNLAFGQDIVFSFGPYASIYTQQFHPATDLTMMIGGAYLALSFFGVTWLIFKNSSWLIQVGLVFSLSALSIKFDLVSTLYLDFFANFYQLLVGIFVYKAINSSWFDDIPIWKAYATLVALFAPFGLFVLIKGTLLASGLAILVLSAALLFYKKKRWLAVLVIVIFVASTVLFWFLANQPLGGLTIYFKNLLPIISGYSEAMSVTGNSKEALVYVFSSIVLIGLIYRKSQGSVYEKAAIALMFASILFLVFKHGFVRHDLHSMIAAMAIVMASIAAATLIPRNQAIIVLVLSLMTWIYIDSGGVQSSPSSLANNIKTTYVDAWNGAKLRLINSQQLNHDFDQSLKQLKQRSGIPLLAGTSDIYSFDQSQLIASGYEWNPRPVIQSYSAYTPSLIAMNKDHLFGENYPDNIVFRVQPIDNRFPALEDGASWPILLSEYEPVSFTNRSWILRHRGSHSAPTLTQDELFKNEYSLGDHIDVPESDSPLFVKMNIQKSFIGVVFNTLYKPSQLKITVVLDDGTTKSCRMIASMAKTGFVLSPLIEETQDFGLLFDNMNVSSNKTVKSIVIEPKNRHWMWRRGV